MPRTFKRPSDDLPSPFVPDWRQRFKDREDMIVSIFESDPGFIPTGWVVEGLLPRGYLALLAGKPKDGKTCLAAALAHAVSQGLPFAGMNTFKTPVLYFAAEESAEEWNLAIDPFLPRERDGLRVGHPTNLRIDRHTNLWGLRLALRRYHAGLIVVDPLLAACDSGDFSGASRARNALMGLKVLCMEQGVAALVVHHAKVREGRATRVAESPQLAATASLNLVLNHRPAPEGRVVTLDLMDRGAFANRKIGSSAPPPAATPPPGRPIRRPRALTVPPLYWPPPLRGRGSAEGCAPASPRWRGRGSQPPKRRPLAQTGTTRRREPLHDPRKGQPPPQKNRPKSPTDYKKVFL